MSTSWRSLKREKRKPLSKWYFFSLGFSTGVIFAITVMYIVGSLAGPTKATAKVLLCLL